MRDPLRNVSVRYKLAFAFAGVCLLAFGVGGYLVSRSAMASLEREIFRRLDVQSQADASALEGSLRALGQRARDFASDGYIREQLVAVTESPAVEAVVQGLRSHLVENKLPIVPAFTNLALVTDPDEPFFLAVAEDAGWTAGLEPYAFGDSDWHSGFHEPDDPGSYPYLILATPLRSISGDRRIGSLLAKVHPGVWIAGALGTMPGMHGGELARTAPSLQLLDGAGRALPIPSALQERPQPSLSSELVLSGFGLRLGNALRENDVSERGVFTRRLPMANGWMLECELVSRDAFEAVSGLQARILIIGVVLTIAASLLLLFPMQFLARPLRELQQAAKEMRDGNFSARVVTDSTDEVGELATSFNLMAEAVEERAAKLQATAYSLEQRKDELRKERDRLDAVIRSMRDGLIVLEPDGAPVVWNAAAQPLIDDSERGGRTMSSHRICQGQHANGSAGSEARADESPCHSCLFDPAAAPRSCLIDVGTSVYEVHSTRLASQTDGRSGRVLVARDVTDRIAQDERLIHQERLAVLGEVAAVVAHELNNPLAAISMFAQMVAKRLPADSDLREDVAVIERNTNTCSRTIRELLDYATGATPEVGPVDVHATLEDVGRFLRAMRERKEVELVLTLGAADALVVGDEVQLRQVFVNLILNALQAVGDRDGRVEVRTWIDAGGHLVVDVIDDGPGIPQTVGNEIFKPFYTTKPRGAGTGLGLPTARRITEIQGGSLELHDARIGHTTFRVRLLRGNA